MTDENNILKIFPVQGPQAVKAKQDILNLVVGVDCSNLNAFSYGSVDINSKTGVANVTLKDESGRTIRDETNQNIACTKTFGTESSTSSSPTSTTQNLDTPKRYHKFYRGIVTTTAEKSVLKECSFSKKRQDKWIEISQARKKATERL